MLSVLTGSQGKYLGFLGVESINVGKFHVMVSFPPPHPPLRQATTSLVTLNLFICLLWGHLLLVFRGMAVSFSISILAWVAKGGSWVVDPTLIIIYISSHSVTLIGSLIIFYLQIDNNHMLLLKLEIILNFRLDSTQNCRFYAIHVIIWTVYQNN